MWALTRLERDGAYLDRLITELHYRAGPDHRNQNLAEAIVKGVLENQTALEDLLAPLVTKFDRSAPELRAALFVGAAQLKVLDGVPAHAAVSETVNAARRLLGSTRAGLVNAVLRRVSASPLKLEQISGLPTWVNARFTEQYGAEAPALLEALDTQLPLFVRVNPLRSSAQECVALLAECRVTAEPFPDLPEMLVLKLNGARIPDKVFAKGVCTVQDPSAALVAIALDPHPGERVLDLCAAPGGKTTHIAELMGDRGLIQASDINEKRLTLVAQHAARLGITSIQTRQADATKLSSIEDLFDRVLLDAPCSGTGVLAKKRDALAKKQEDDIARLVTLQRALLSQAAARVRPGGGVLVYSTCSLDFAENEEQVTWFLEHHPDFSLSPSLPSRLAPFQSAPGMIKALPHKHHCAGGFCAAFVRAAS